jgi:hypothetical protein
MLDKFLNDRCIYGLFGTMANNLGDPFLPVPPGPLLEMARSILKETFVAEIGIVNPTPSATFGDDLYQLVILTMSSKNLMLIQLLLHIFHLMFHAHSGSVKSGHFQAGSKPGSHLCGAFRGHSFMNHTRSACFFADALSGPIRFPVVRD